MSEWMKEMERMVEAAERQRIPDGWKLVPSEFVTGFTTLAHNYSLRVEPPEHYSGTEADAFRHAYARCGRDLAELRSMLAAVTAREAAPNPNAIAGKGGEA